jgi:ubiquinone/menaquinone biosynthesis C-methylase UbiE
VGSAHVSESDQHGWDRQAREYDANAWTAKTADQEREIADLIRTLAALPLAHTLDLACGTGFLTQHLRGQVTLLDASDAMLAIAANRLPESALVCGNALPIPFADSSFDRVLSSQFFHHLRPEDRRLFLTEVQRVAPELVLVENVQGTEHRGGPTHFTAASLLAELGAGELLHEGRSFLVTRTFWDGVAL